MSTFATTKSKGEPNCHRCHELLQKITKAITTMYMGTIVMHMNVWVEHQYKSNQPFSSF
jgi:hypothetical protein